MTMLAGPHPGVGKESRVRLGNVPLEYVPGTWHVEEAPRFGEKLSTGSLRYADFNPYESAHSIADWGGGYGLRRYSDVENPDDDHIRTMYFEADGVDCRNGSAILAPARTSETLTGATGDILWLGEFTPSSGALSGVRTIVAVTTTKVFYRDTAAAGTWTDSGIGPLGVSPVRGAIGVFNDRLIIGFGAASVGYFTTNLSTVTAMSNSTPANIYVGAFTADRAAAYVAGGTTAASSLTNVISSTNGGTGYALDSAAVVCGSSFSAITALAPGGGLNTVYVQKYFELGAIDNSAVYKILLPFDNLVDRGAGLRWWLGRGGDQQRGPLTLLFTRDRSPWLYQPSTSTAGEASNIAPWADPSLRPSAFRGVPEAFQGTATWLYYTIKNGSNRLLVARNTLTSDNHSIFTVGTGSAYAMLLSTNFTDSQPRMLISQGVGIRVFVLPLDGDSPLDDTACRYTSTGTLITPEIDLGFPDETKIFYTVNVVADALVPAAQQIQVEFSVDGSAYTSLGTVSTSPSQELTFPAQTTGKRMKLRFTLTTTSNTLTPILLGCSVRMSLNPKLYRVITFDAKLPTANAEHGGFNLRNAKTDMDTLWSMRRTGFPFNFTDRWSQLWTARLLKVEEKEGSREPNATPETLLTLTILEIAAGAGNNAYDSSSTAYDAAYTRYA